MADDSTEAPRRHPDRAQTSHRRVTSPPATARGTAESRGVQTEAPGAGVSPATPAAPASRDQAGCRPPPGRRRPAAAGGQARRRRPSRAAAGEAPRAEGGAPVGPPDPPPPATARPGFITACRPRFPAVCPHVSYWVGDWTIVVPAVAPARGRASSARRAGRRVRHVLGRDGHRLAAAPGALRRGLLPVLDAAPPSRPGQGEGRPRPSRCRR